MAGPSQFFGRYEVHYSGADLKTLRKQSESTESGEAETEQEARRHAG